MPVRRDPRTGRWFFRTIVKLPDGTRRRVFGTPGTPGKYQDLVASKVGAQEAEWRAIAEIMTGKPARGASPKREEDSTSKQRKLAHYVEDFITKYAGEHRACERRKKRSIWNSQLKEHFGHQTLATISQDHVDTFVVEQRTRLAKKTVANRLAVLSSLVKYAAERERVAKPRLRLTLGRIVGEVEAVPMADVDKLVAAADPLYRTGVLLAAEAGLRAGEIRGLQWGDFRDGMIKVRRSLDTHTGEVTLPKHDKFRDVPISDRLADAFKTLPKQAIWVLSNADGSPLHHTRDLWTSIVKLYERAGVPRPASPVHCLRHTYGTELAARGVPLPVIQRLMGHSDVRTTMQYITVGEDQLRDAVADAFGRGSGVAAGKKNRGN